jgi:hypothetical protein
MPSTTEDDISFMQGVESILKGTYGKDTQCSVSTTKKGSKAKETKNVLEVQAPAFDKFHGTPRGKYEINHCEKNGFSLCLFHHLSLNQ